MDRRWILPVLALLALLTVPAAATAAPARTAHSFVDSIGVNTHTYYNDTVYYSRFDDVKRRLAELGVRHIRENLVPDRPDQYERLNELADRGIKSTLIVGDPNEGKDGLEELVSILKTEVRRAVAAAEGPNEFDMFGGDSWLPELDQYQRWLHSALKSDPSLAGLPLIGPSIVQHRNQRALDDISGLLDYGNIHSYPDGYSPESNLDDHLQRAAHNSAAKPVMATESGYHTAVGWPGEHNPASESAMATYVPRMFLEYFRRGIRRTFSYELLDEDAGATEREDSFGLLRNDLSPKPAFTALRNTISILSDPGPAFAPIPLAYALNGDLRGLRHLLLQKRDGSYYLALWRASDIWDPEAQAPLAGTFGPVQIGFARQVLGAELYSPNASPAPVAGLPVGGGPLSFTVGPQVTILKIVAGGAASSGRIKLWLSRQSVPTGGRVAVKGRLPSSATGHRPGVAVQHWRGRKRGGWRTVGRGRASHRGVFRKRIRLSRARFGRVTKLRVVARAAKPSRIVRLRIRHPNQPAYRAGLAGGRSVVGGSTTPVG